MCREMGRTDAAGQVSPHGCHPHRALCPMTIDHLSCPSQLSSWGGAGDPPSPSSIATSFPPAEIYLLLCCPSSLPQVRCWGGLHGATPLGESGESCVHSKKGSPLPVSCPFLAGLLEPQRTAHGCQSVEEVSRNGNFPGSKSGCQMTAPLEHPFPGRPGLSSILHTEDKACTGPCGWRARKTLASVPPCGLKVAT